MTVLERGARILFLSVDKLLCLFPQILDAIFSGKRSHRAKIPVEGQDGGSLGAMGKDTLPILHDQTGSLPKIQRLLCAGSVADQ